MGCRFFTIHERIDGGYDAYCCEKHSLNRFMEVKNGKKDYKPMDMAGQIWVCPS